MTAVADHPALHSIETLGEIQLDAEYLTRALRAALPHVSKDDDLPALHCVRLTIEAGIMVTATDRYTAAFAWIPPEHLDDYDGTAWVADLLPEDAKLLVDMFTPGKDEQITLRLSATSDQIHIRDVSGLFAGRELLVPHPAGGDAVPDLRSLLRTVITTDTPPVPSATWAFQPALWARFARSAAAYKETVMEVEPGRTPGSAFRVTIGRYFAGLAMPVTQSADIDPDSTRRLWLDRLPEDTE